MINQSENCFILLKNVNLTLTSNLRVFRTLIVSSYEFTHGGLQTKQCVLCRLKRFSIIFHCTLYIVGIQQLTISRSYVRRIGSCDILSYHSTLFSSMRNISGTQKYAESSKEKKRKDQSSCSTDEIGKGWRKIIYLGLSFPGDHFAVYRFVIYSSYLTRLRDRVWSSNNHPIHMA